MSSKAIRVELADNMPLDRWTAYMWCILITEKLTKTHYLCTVNGESWIKPKQR
jgi:hypothetical protein